MSKEGFSDRTLVKDLSNIDFLTIKKEDYSIFDRFRSLRANFYIQSIWKVQKQMSVVETN